MRIPIDHAASHHLTADRRGDGGIRLDLVHGGADLRSVLDRTLRRHLVVTLDDDTGETHRFAPEGPLDLPSDAVSATLHLGDERPFRLLGLSLGEPLEVVAPYRLSPFETRFLADNGVPHPVARPELVPSGLTTDLHTHFAGCVSPDDLIAIGLAHDVTYPAELLARAGIRVDSAGDVALASLAEPLRSRLAAGLAVPLEKQITFLEMETIYRLRAPLTKGRAAFVPLLRKIASDYAAMRVRYVELSLFDVLDTERLRTIHRELPAIEEESGVTVRFLAAFNRHDDPEWDLDLVERVKQLARSRYLAGVDFMGHETNSTRAFAPILTRLAEWAGRERPGFVLRVHAGENPAHPENVRVALESVAGHDVSLRIGHGLYGVDDGTLDTLRRAGAIVEFNLNSNFALNNLQTSLGAPIRRYLAAGVDVVLGTDGYGIYRNGPDLEAQVARLSGVTDDDLARMRAAEGRHVERQRAIAASLPVDLDVPGAPPPRHYTDGIEARKRVAKEARDRALRARLDLLGVPLLDGPAAGALLASRTAVSVAGAWKKSWEIVSPPWRDAVARELSRLADALDPARAVFVTGGTHFGVEDLVQRAAARCGIPVLGVLVWATPPESLAEGAITHAHVVAEKLHGKAAGLYRLMKEAGGLCLFVGGGTIVGDEIQTAANLRVPHLLMDGPEGASTEHARLSPARSFTTADEVLEALSRKGRWHSVDDPYWHLGANPTVDVVVTRRNPATGVAELLLIQRDDEAPTEAGKWALPGGFQTTDAPRGTPWTPGPESARDAAARELLEETGLDVRDLAARLIHVGDFEGDGRDPRDTGTAWSRSSAFALRLPDDRASAPIAGGDDAGDARWFPLDAVPRPLAFDHDRIVAKGLAALERE